MSTLDWRIPSSTLRWLDEAPQDRPVMVLLRHSVRGALPADDVGYHLPITAEGWCLAQSLGERLGGRLKTLRTSPLARCVQTAEALAAGADFSSPVVPDRLLGDPGVYVLDEALAWQNWQTLGHAQVMEHLMGGFMALPGMAQPNAAAHRLVRHMSSMSGARAGMHVFVTHDSLVAATAAQLLGQPLGQDAWPEYLEGAFFWHGARGVHTAYRAADRRQEFAAFELPGGEL